MSSSGQLLLKSSDPERRSSFLATHIPTHVSKHEVCSSRERQEKEHVTPIFPRWPFTLFSCQLIHGVIYAVILT